MTSILPSIKDRKLKDRYRGEVLIFDAGTTEVAAVVYGRTLEIMRHRKHAVTAVIREVFETEPED